MELCFGVEDVPVGARGRCLERVEESLLLRTKSGEQVGACLEPASGGVDVDVVGHGGARDGMSFEAWKEYFFTAF